MKKRPWGFAVVIIVLIFGSGFLLGRSNVLGAKYTDSYLAGQPTGTDFTLFWEAWTFLQKKYPFGQPTTEEKIYGAINGLAAAYGDPYTMFFDPSEAQEFNEEVTGTFGGVGMELGMKNNVLTVIAPLKGTPADRAGIVAGDVLISINDTSTNGMSVNEAVKAIRGEPGTSVVLGFVRTDAQQEQTLTLVREKISVPNIETEQKGDVFVISLYTFTEDSGTLFTKALEEFKRSGSHKLVIDLRDNPGGYLQSAIDIASWFVPQGKVIVSEDLGENTQKIDHRSKGFPLGVQNLEVVVLVNGGSASASEIVAGALKEQGIATVVGEQTYGKGSVQELLDLNNKTAIKITVARWLTPLGHSISEQGLTPDVFVEVTSDDIKNEHDPQLAKALELLD